MRRTTILSALFLLFAGMEVFAKAAEPVFMVGGLCPAGSARIRPWVLFEDRNGDGYFDFMTAGDCNGDVRGRPWNPSVDEAPFTPLETDIYIGQLPHDVANVSPDFSLSEESNGLYSWTIIERAGVAPGGGQEVCRVTRNASGVLSTTCTPNEGYEGDLQ